MIGPCIEISSKRQSLPLYINFVKLVVQTSQETEIRFQLFEKLAFQTSQ
jgi:hypothetical protein